MIEPGKTIEDEQLVGPSNAPIKTIKTKKGVAMGCKESHPLRIEIERIRMLQPSQIRRLLEENMSLGEIMAVIAEDANPTFLYKGRIWVGEDDYKLVDIDYEEVGFVLNADLVPPYEGLLPRRDGEVVVGHIAVREGVRAIEGELSMDLGSYCDSYAVLLDPAHGGS